MRCTPPSTVMTTFVSGISDPIEMDFNAAGDMFVTDYNRGVSGGGVWKVTTAGGSPVTLFNHSMNGCNGFTKGPDGNFYAASYDYDEIWKITPAGVGTLFSGLHNVSGHVDGTLAAARFNTPSGMIFRDGILYIAEYSNNDVRTIGDFPTPVEDSSWGRIKALYR